MNGGVSETSARNPAIPISPFDPVNPVFPRDPVKPITPCDPVNPITPCEPVKPYDPVHPFTPSCWNHAPTMVVAFAYPATHLNAIVDPAVISYDSSAL